MYPNYNVMDSYHDSLSKPPHTVVNINANSSLHAYGAAADRSAVDATGNTCALRKRGYVHNSRREMVSERMYVPKVSYHCENRNQC